MEKWLVISNCQTFGLANSLSLMQPNKSVSGIDTWAYEQDKDRLDPTLSEYERIFANEHTAQLPGIAAHAERLATIPSVQFFGYHPDLCYVTAGGRIIKSPLDDYHSLICFAAFKSGLPEEKAIALYTDRTYRAADYYRFWHEEKQRFLEAMTAAGYDLTQAFRRWSVRECFMYSNNHPKIVCLYDLAAIASEKAGHKPALTGFTPHDNLANAVAFPVYPELAETFGVPGSYNFKLGGQYRVIDLEQFVRSSYDEYRKHDTAELSTGGWFETRFRSLMQMLQ